MGPTGPTAARNRGSRRTACMEDLSGSSKPENTAELTAPGLIWVNLGYWVLGYWGWVLATKWTHFIGFMGIRYDEIGMEHANLIPVA